MPSSKVSTGVAKDSVRKSALITGASSGIGKATALYFTRHGFDVAVLARRGDLLEELAALIKKKSPERRVVTLRADVSEWTEVEQASRELEKEFGQINVLVNNAGAFEHCPLEQSSPAQLDSMIDVNVRGVVYVTKAMLPLLQKAAPKWAKIVNVSSISGLWGFSNMSVYTATKFAVAGFSSGLRRELAPARIGVGTIFPGPVDTKGEANGSGPKFVMFPDQIARQIFQLATTRRKNRISHPAFSVLNALERVSPAAVDKILKFIG